MTSSVIGAVAERASLATVNVEAIRRQIAEVRPDLSESTLTCRAAVVLLLGPQLRFNIDRMTARTRYPRAQVAACARRLFDHGVWRPEGPDYRWSSVADAEFWLDVAVAEGQRIRRVGELGDVEWAEPGSWTKAYDFVTRDTSLTVAYVGAPAAPARTEADEEEEQAVAPEPVELDGPVVVAERVERVERAPALAAAGFPGGEPTMTGSTESVVRTKWARPEGVRRSDMFPDAQWLS